MSVDLVIRGGTVVDGTGRAPYAADVAVHDGRIVAVGALDESAAQEIDAEGHVVTPGFIDGHTHMDAQVFWDRLGTNSCWHGVTTVVMGNCGFTLAPAHADQRELVLRNLERAEGMDPDVLVEGLPWTWSTFPEYMDAVDRVPKGINYAASIGHSALRTWAMGERAFVATADADDLARMGDELRRALRAGAIGFTTSRATHETSDDRPVASRQASWDEVRALVGVLGDEGRGIFQLAPELGMQFGAEDPDLAVRADCYERMRALTCDTGVPIGLPVPATHDCRDVLGLIDSTPAPGRMFALSHSRGIAIVLSFRTALPFDNLPEWAEVRGLPIEEQRVRLLDPEVRARLVHAAHHGRYARAIGTQARPPDYSTMRIMQSPYQLNPTVAEDAARRGVDPVEAMIDDALETDFTQFWYQPVLAERDEDRLAVMRHPNAVMTFSDSGAHVNEIVDCSIQTHLLARWVRDEQALTLEDAVRMITSAPARAWGLVDRGTVRAGAIADLNVWDPATVGPDLPEVAHDLPTGASRLVQRATGFRATVVDGAVVIREGEPTGAMRGALLRGPFEPTRG